MNSLSELVQQARRLQASDIHLESGAQVYFRCDGKLRNQGGPISFDKLRQWTIDLLGPRYETLKTERSFDFSEQLGGARCRIHIFYSARGLSYSIRLLAQAQPTLAGLNLHPNFEKILQLQNGLILISGPTGSGKSTTLAALVHELNVKKSLHIITLEQPIEYFHPNQNCLIRQREVGRDTPSFEQGLKDSLREDPDVILVGELRERETIQLTLNAAETGHLVFATLHASNVSDAIQRILSAFPAEIREHTMDQLSQVLQVVVCQTLALIPKFDELAPICELFFTTTAARSKIRAGDYTTIGDTYYGGADAGCLHREKYRQWLESKPKLLKASRKEGAPAAPETLIQERFETPAPAPKKSGSPAAADAVYTIEDPDDDLWTAIRDLEK